MRKSACDFTRLLAFLELVFKISSKRINVFLSSLSLVVPPVKKLVSAYNEQMLRRQHNSAYASLCRVVTSPAQGPPTGLSAHGPTGLHAQVGPPRAQPVVQATVEPIYVNIYAASK